MAAPAGRTFWATLLKLRRIMKSESCQNCQARDASLVAPSEQRTAR
jgi:hypothetical protein